MRRGCLRTDSTYFNHDGWKYWRGVANCRSALNNATPCRGRQRIESPLKMWFVGSLSTGYGGQPTKSCRGGARELHAETESKQDDMTQLCRKSPEMPRISSSPRTAIYFPHGKNAGPGIVYARSQITSLGNAARNVRF